MNKGNLEELTEVLNNSAKALERAEKGLKTLNEQMKTVEVNAKLTIDKNTADLCLKMVEKYVNDTGDLIVVRSREDGTTEYEFKVV